MDLRPAARLANRRRRVLGPAAAFLPLPRSSPAPELLLVGRGRFGRHAWASRIRIRPRSTVATANFLESGGIRSKAARHSSIFPSAGRICAGCRRRLPLGFGEALAGQELRVLFRRQIDFGPLVAEISAGQRKRSSPSRRGAIFKAESKIGRQAGYCPHSNRLLPSRNRPSPRRSGGIHGAARSSKYRPASRNSLSRSFPKAFSASQGRRRSQTKAGPPTSAGSAFLPRQGLGERAGTGEFPFVQKRKHLGQHGRSAGRV